MEETVTEKNICAVVVTYNRLALLKQTLASYERQTLPFASLIIIDNASNDGTKEYLDSYQPTCYQLFVFHLPSNGGGAGGNAFGIQKAIELTKCPWIFVSDDDAFLAPDLLERFVTYRQSHAEEAAVAYATSVYHGDVLEMEHRARIKKQLFRIKRTCVPASEYQKESFAFDLITFVGAFFARSAIEKVGYPDPGFFIHYDDTEYSCRLRKLGKLICLPACHIDHQDAFGNPLRISWRTYYDIRNKAYTIRKHFGKWYYDTFVWRTYFFNASCLYAPLVKRYNKATRAMYRKALRDAGKPKLSMDEVYNPLHHQEFK